MDIKLSIDIEDEVRKALSPFLQSYCRPLPKELITPSISVTVVGGSDANDIDTFEVTLDSRAKEEAEAYELLRRAIGILKAVAREQTTAIRHITVNSSGSWGNDPARPDLAMCSARLQITTHITTDTISPKK